MAKLFTFLDRVITINQGDTVLIGRQASKAGAPVQSPSNMLFQSSVISRAHATLQLRNGDLLITDTGSLHGTSVNDERVSDARVLKTGDMLELGMDLTKGSVYHTAIKGRVTVGDAPVTPPDERTGQQHDTVSGSPTPRSFGLPTSKSRERLINQTDDFSASSFSDDFDDYDFDDEDEIEWEKGEVDATAVQADETALMDEQDARDVLADDLMKDRLDDDAIQETMSPEAQPKLDFSVATMTSAMTQSPASATDTLLVPAVAAPATVVPREKTVSVKDAPVTSDQPATTCKTSAENKIMPAPVKKTSNTPAQSAAMCFVKTFKANTKSKIASESARSTDLEMRPVNKMHDAEQQRWDCIEPRNANDSPRIKEIQRPDLGSHVKCYTAAKFAHAMTTLPALLVQFERTDLSSDCQVLLEAAISMLTFLAKDSDQEQAFPASTPLSACKRLLDLLPVGNAVFTQQYQPDSSFWLMAITTADMLDSIVNLLYRQRTQDGRAESMRMPPAGKKRPFDETHVPSDASLSTGEPTTSPAKKAKLVASASTMRPVVVGMLLGSVFTFCALASLG